jgi:hypothetical protein
MKYQLILQWPAISIKDYDTLIEIEDILLDTLTDGSEIDGHDAGTGEMNIFIHTDDPMSTFNIIKSAIGTGDYWVGIRAAYRELGGSGYTVLWPKDSYEFRIS